MTEPTGRSTSKAKRRFFYAALGLFILALLAVESVLLVKLFKQHTGHGLNRRAWVASYTERQMPVPPLGRPREGFWGKYLAAVKDKGLDFILPERHEPGMFEIDRFGRQYAGSRSHPQARVLILGGSVAAGAYVSNEPRVYFHQMAYHLARHGRRVAITVQATGAWTSFHELKALRLQGLALKPDYILFLNGLNDAILPKQLSEEERVRAYLERMREARDLAAARGIKVIFAPQPFLMEKRKKTALETLLIFESYWPPRALEKTYNDLRAGLRKLVVPGQAYYMDCSNVFSDQPFTTFSDIWHFSDPGHALLGEHMADKLDLLLRSKSPVDGKTQGMM